MVKILLWIDVILWIAIGTATVITGHPVYIRVLLGLLVVDTLLVRWMLAQQAKAIARVTRMSLGIGL
jgi:hypothetical protein